MEYSKIIRIDSEYLLFNNGFKLYKSHGRLETCENHYLDFDELSFYDIEYLKFDLTNDNYFKRNEGYGITLLPINGHPVRIRGYSISYKQINFNEINSTIMKDKYVIIDIRNMDFMKDKDGKINYYDTEEDACLTCGMYEFENAWVMKLIYNHIETE